MILYCIEVISLLLIALLTIDEYRITREILYFFGLFIFVSICHILLLVKGKSFNFIGGGFYYETIQKNSGESVSMDC